MQVVARPATERGIVRSRAGGRLSAILPVVLGLLAAPGFATPPVPIALETAGYELETGQINPLISRGAELPSTGREVFAPGAKGERSLSLHILATLFPGDERSSRSLAHVTIGPFIPSAEPWVRVEFSMQVDTNGYLSFEARNLDEGGREVPIEVDRPRSTLRIETTSR